MTDHEQPRTASNNGTIDEKTYNKNILKELCSDNANFFSKDNSENGQRLYISFLGIIDALDSLWPKRHLIEKRSHEFDYDSSTPGNGYRSFIAVLDSAISLAVELNETVLQRRNSVLFRKTQLTKDVECSAHLLASLDGLLNHLLMLISWAEDGDLFVDDAHSPEELFKQCGEINQHCFYGRHLGFHYCDSIKNILQFIALSMTLFSEVYYCQGSILSKTTNSVMSTTKYILDPEQRARRIVNISQNAEVDFCKSFWFLAESELMNQLPSIVSPSIAISKVINLPPEALFTNNIDGDKIEIPVPESYLGRKQLQVRLISYKMREGMIGTKTKGPVEPPSKNLIVHCHGGGFVAQSSKSHEGYLRDWAKQLDTPILCIDYSLAPEAPFPRALEEVLYAYCWARNNYELLGSTGEHIVCAGDSAGANLLISCTLKCLELRVPPPGGLFLAYVPTGVHMVPSPARMLCMMDPLLPLGFLMRCLKAYAFPPQPLTENNKDNNSQHHSGSSDTESFEEISESDLVELQAHKSPVSEASDTLTYGSLTSIDENNATGGNSIEVDAVEKSQKYVSEFLEKYVLESDTETDGSKITVQQRPESMSSTSTHDYAIHKKLSSLVAGLKCQFSKYLGERSPSAAEQVLDMDVDTSQVAMMEKFKFVVPKNPYLSPIYAADADLMRFPPVRVLTVHMDPCLDDCITFAKRLRRLNCNIKLDILDGLPHGFLNFSLFSREAYEGSKVCIERIQELLNLH